MDQVQQKASETFFGAITQLDPVLQLLIMVLVGLSIFSIGTNVWLVRFIFRRLLTMIERNFKIKTALIDEFKRMRAAK